MERPTEKNPFFQLEEDYKTKIELIKKQNGDQRDLFLLATGQMLIEPTKKLINMIQNFNQFNELKVPLEEEVLVDKIKHILAHEFVVTAVGETNSGKSTFLSVLTHHLLCSSDPFAHSFFPIKYVHTPGCVTPSLYIPLELRKKLNHFLSLLPLVPENTIKNNSSYFSAYQDLKALHHGGGSFPEVLENAEEIYKHIRYMNLLPRILMEDEAFRPIIDKEISLLAPPGESNHSVASWLPIVKVEFAPFSNVDISGVLSFIDAPSTQKSHISCLDNLIERCLEYTSSNILVVDCHRVESDGTADLILRIKENQANSATFLHGLRVVATKYDTVKIQLDKNQSQAPDDGADSDSDSDSEEDQKRHEETEKAKKQQVVDKIVRYYRLLKDPIVYVAAPKYYGTYLAAKKYAEEKDHRPKKGALAEELIELLYGVNANNRRLYGKLTHDEWKIELERVKSMSGIQGLLDDLRKELIYAGELTTLSAVKYIQESAIQFHQTLQVTRTLLNKDLGMLKKALETCKKAQESIKGLDKKFERCNDELCKEISRLAELQVESFVTNECGILNDDIATLNPLRVPSETVEGGSKARLAWKFVSTWFKTLKIRRSNASGDPERGTSHVNLLWNSKAAKDADLNDLYDRAQSQLSFIIDENNARIGAMISEEMRQLNEELKKLSDLFFIVVPEGEDEQLASQISQTIRLRNFKVISINKEVWKAPKLNLAMDVPSLKTRDDAVNINELHRALLEGIQNIYRQACGHLAEQKSNHIREQTNKRVIIVENQIKHAEAQLQVTINGQNKSTAEKEEHLSKLQECENYVKAFITQLSEMYNSVKSGQILH